MAGDWMKIELELSDKPEVHGIAGMLSIDPDLVVGKLLRVWQWFDKHTTDGNAYGVTYLLVDRITTINGFGEAMSFVGWLEQKDKYLVMPKFDKHTSKSAKSRANTSLRVKRHRNETSNDDVTVDELPREEKRRDIKHTCETHFDVFWKTYPNNRKVAKKNCKQKWKAKNLDAIAEKILADVKSKISQWGEFNPAPLTYLNQERWNDDEGSGNPDWAKDML